MYFRAIFDIFDSSISCATKLYADEICPCISVSSKVMAKFVKHLPWLNIKYLRLQLTETRYKKRTLRYLNRLYLFEAL